MEYIETNNKMIDLNLKASKNNKGIWLNIQLRCRDHQTDNNTTYCLKWVHFKYNDRNRWNIGWKKICRINTSQKKAAVAISTLEKKASGQKVVSGIKKVIS